MTPRDSAPALLSGSSHRALAVRLAGELGLSLTEVQLGEFPDGELHVEVPKSVAGRHAVLLQATCAPAERHLFELCLLADGCRRQGAERITAVIPYFGYARQDRRTAGGEAVGVRVALDLLAAAPIDRIVAVDVHGGAIEAVSPVRFEHLTALPLLLRALRATPGSDYVVVAPDLGAAKLAQRAGRALDAPVALVHKTRRTGAEVEAHALSGEVRGRTPIVLDDMISTGGTLEAAARALIEAGCRPPLLLAAVHGLFVGPAIERLSRLPIARLIATDSVPAELSAPIPLERVSLAGLLAQAVRAVHEAGSVDDDLLRR